MNIRISQLENQLKACRELIKAQENKICELATKLEYAKRTIENLTPEEPKKEEDPQYLYVYNHRIEGRTYVSTTLMHETYGNWIYMGKVRVEK
jgi:cupin superfamily acireductone dioxygenase involved in methionine salvage